MSRKVSYYVQQPEKNDQPLQIIIGSAADKKIAEEEKQKNQFKAFNSQYYGAVTEYGLYNGVRQWLRVQDLRKYAAAGIGFKVNHPYGKINHRQTGAILKSASAHLFGNLGIEIPIDIEYPKFKEEWVRDQAGNRFRATIFDDDLEGGAACIQPSLGRRIRFGTNTVPDSVATLVETQGLTTQEALTQVSMGSAIHETVHAQAQFFADPRIVQEVDHLNKVIDTTIARVGEDLLTFDRLSPQEVQQRYEKYLDALQQKEPNLIAALRQKGLPYNELSKLSFDKTVDFNLVKAIVKDHVVPEGIFQWHMENIDLRTMGLATPEQEILLSWQEYRNNSTRGIARREAEAYLAQTMFENAGSKNPPEKFSYIYGDGEFVFFPEKNFPFSKGYTNLDTPKDTQLIKGLTTLVNNRVFINSVHGVDLIGNFFFVVDLANGVNSIYHYEQDSDQAFFDGTRGFFSTIAGISGITAIVSRNPVTRVFGRNISGPIGATIAFAHSVGQFLKDVEDTDRKEKVSTTEKVLTGTGMLGNGMLVVGVLSALAVGSGGTLIPVILIFGGMGISTGSEIAHAEVQEERVAETLAKNLKKFHQQTSRFQEEYEAVKAIAELLADNDHELDDDALLDFFEIAEKDPYLKKHLIQILAHPTFAPLRDKIIEQFISPQTHLPNSFSDIFTQLGNFLAYQRDEEGAWGMIAALLQYKKEDLETEKLDEIRKYVQAVASRLDYSDWKTFKKLLKEYDLKLDDIDPGCFIRYYMAA